MSVCVGTLQKCVRCSARKTHRKKVAMDDRAGSKVVKAEVPLSEMFGYVTSLRTLSSGRATSTMEFSHYAETPSNISESVIAEVNGNKA